MNGYVTNGQVMQPQEPLLINIDGQVDNNRHPFIVISQDDEAVYGFHMTSSKVPANIIGDLSNVTLVAREQVEYYNKLITQNAYVRVDYIHKITYEEMVSKCNPFGFVKPNTQEILRELITQHLFLSDYELIPNDEYTDTVIALNNLTKAELRCSKKYDESRKDLNNPAYADVINNRINTVRLYKEKLMIFNKLSQIKGNKQDEYEEVQTSLRRRAA